jgi:flavodoxin
MKIGIVYYSRTGNTRQTAKMIEEKCKEKKADVDLIEIEHVKRPGFFAAGRASSKQLDLPIKDAAFDMKKYDRLIVGCPTWAGKPSPFMKVFLNQVKNIKGKTVAVFGTGMSPIDKRDQFKEIMKSNIEKAGAKTFDTFLTLEFKRGRLTNGGQHIESFVSAFLQSN